MDIFNVCEYIFSPEQLGPGGGFLSARVRVRGAAAEGVLLQLHAGRAAHRTQHQDRAHQNELQQNKNCRRFISGGRSCCDLTTAILHNAYCIFICFQFYEHLITIDLSSNIIEDIEDKSFAAQKSLIKLSLANNKLSDLSTKVDNYFATLKSRHDSKNPHNEYLRLLKYQKVDKIIYTLQQETRLSNFLTLTPSPSNLNKSYLSQ